MKVAMCYLLKISLGQYYSIGLWGLLLPKTVLLGIYMSVLGKIGINWYVIHCKIICRGWKI
ncbi:hypothetical [Yersinia pestis KIM10+]|uniref:Uncharacterized protein n=1 Tax=Yersinia pestis TaxID=632 RepID=Q8CLR5_YERPE|nr:hypothetical [Yersinia pestis KIM10+]